MTESLSLLIEVLANDHFVQNAATRSQNYVCVGLIAGSIYKSIVGKSNRRTIRLQTFCNFMGFIKKSILDWQSQNSIYVGHYYSLLHSLSIDAHSDMLNIL